MGGGKGGMRETRRGEVGSQFCCLDAHLHREFASLPPSHKTTGKDKKKKTPVYINWGHTDPMSQVWM